MGVAWPGPWESWVELVPRPAALASPGNTREMQSYSGAVLGMGVVTALLRGQAKEGEREERA